MLVRWGWRRRCSTAAASQTISIDGPTRLAPAGAPSRLFRSETGLSFAEWQAQLRTLEGLAHVSTGASVAETAAVVRYASASALSAMIHYVLGGPPRQLTRPMP